MDYKIQIKHPNWISKRNEILALDNYECNICSSKDRLEVHHVTYWGDRNAWHYPNNLLVTLCRKCHQNQHAKGNTKNFRIINLWMGRLLKPNRGKL